MKKIYLLIIITVLVGSDILIGQSTNFKVGIFNPATKSDLWDLNRENLYFSKKDMQDFFYGIEYEHFIGRNVSFAVELNSYEKTLNSEYKDYEHNDNTPIYQSISLSISGIEANIKVYPIGHRKILNPYFSIGAGVYYWEYEQWGEFIDFTTGEISDGYANTEAFTPGFNIKAGIVFRFKKYMGVSFEVRYLYLKGRLSSLFEGFEKLDLRGRSLSLGINIFFN